MTFMIILNVVLAVAVIAAVLRLLSWAIVSSPPEQPQPAELRRPTPPPVAPRPRSTPPYHAAPRRPSRAREPVAG